MMVTLLNCGLTATRGRNLTSLINCGLTATEASEGSQPTMM